MKKSKWLVLISLVLCTAMLIASCGESENVLENVFDMEQYVYEDQGITPTKSEALSTYTGWYADEVAGNILMFTKNDSVVLYNIETAKQIYSLSTTITLGIDTVDGVAIGDVAELIWVVTEETVEGALTYKTVIYDEEGTQIATADRKVIPSFNADLMLFDNVCYRISEDGSVAKAFDYNSLSDLPEVEVYNDTYYYDIIHSENMIAVYDKTLKLVNTYTFPSYAEMNAMILNDGNLLIQYAVQQPDDSKDYTYVEGTDKYLLTSLIYDVEKGEAEEIKLDYLLSYGSSRNEKYAIGHESLEYFIEDIENVISAYDIVDERVDTSNSAEKIYAIDNNGKIESTLNIFGKAVIATLPDVVAPDRYIVENALEQVTMYDKAGNVIGDVTNAEFYETYMVADGKIYDYSMKMVYDFENDDMINLAFYDSCALFEKDDETYLYANGAMTKIIDEENTYLKQVVTKDQYFVIVDTSNLLAINYEYYNDTGAKFASSSQMLYDMIAVGDNCLIVSGLNTDGDIVYYRFS